MDESIFQIPFYIDYPLAIGIFLLFASGLLYLAAISKKKVADFWSVIVSFASFNFGSIIGDRDKRIKYFRIGCKVMSCFAGLFAAVCLLVSANVIKNGDRYGLTPGEKKLVKELQEMTPDQLIEEIKKARQEHQVNRIEKESNKANSADAKNRAAD